MFQRRTKNLTFFKFGTQGSKRRLEKERKNGRDEMLDRSYHNVSLSRMFFAFAIFVFAYLCSISVKAQEAIQLNENDTAIVTGIIVNAEDDFLVVNTAGNNMHVTLGDVDLKQEADEVFQPGMSVEVVGEMEGNYFGMPVIQAKSVTAARPKP
jgi:hypothetical protein